MLRFRVLRLYCPLLVPLVFCTRVQRALQTSDQLHELKGTGFTSLWYISPLIGNIIIIIIGKESMSFGRI